MRDLLLQIERSLESEIYYVSLMTALTVPDIAGALSSKNGKAKGTKYSKWYDQWVRPQYERRVLSALPPEMQSLGLDIENPLTGKACYTFRCSLLHQGRASHPKSPFDRIIFIEPGSTTNRVDGIIEDALCIDLPSFCGDVVAGARDWLDSVEGSEPFETNISTFVRRHEGGLSPYIGGVTVIG